MTTWLPCHGSIAAMNFWAPSLPSATSLVPLFAQDRIVVGGGIAAAREFVLEPAKASYLEHASPQYRGTDVVGSPFEGWEGMIGAASLFLSPLT